MKKTNNRSTKEYLTYALRAGEDRLLRNSSKGEQALFICAVVLSFAALIFSAITAIMSKDAITIVRAFTENIFMFFLVAALTVSDRVLVWRRRSLILVLYTLLALAGDGFAFVGATGFLMVLSIIGALAGIALYGTLLFDQFNDSDSPIKYWLVYGGALYKLLYTLVDVIVGGTKAAQTGVIDVLSIIVGGAAFVAVTLMLVYQFDGFSFIKYFFYEIINGEEQDQELADEPLPEKEQLKAHAPSFEVQEDEQEPEYIPFSDIETEPTELCDDADNTEKAEPECVTESEADELVKQADAEQDEIKETEPERYDAYAVDSSESTEPKESAVAEDVLDDFGYVPYDDSTDSDAVDNSVKTITASDEQKKQEYETAYEAYESAAYEDDVLIDESVAETPQESNVETIEDILIDDELETEVEDKQDTKTTSMQDVLDSLTPVERKYIRFALKYHKPEDTLQVEGLAGDLFDVWVDGEVICFQNDLGQASNGRGVRTAAIPFEDVLDIGVSEYGDKDQCIILSYLRGEETIEIGFKKTSFKNFKRVMMACAEDIA